MTRRRPPVPHRSSHWVRTASADGYSPVSALPMTDLSVPSSAARASWLAYPASIDLAELLAKERARWVLGSLDCDRGVMWSFSRRL